MLFNERKMQALEIFTHHCELRPREWAIKAGFYPLSRELNRVVVHGRYFRTLLCLTVLGLSAPALGQAHQSKRSSAAEQQIRAIISELPPHSPVRRHLEQGVLLGDGVSQSYMPLMQQAHVKRVLMEIRGVWRDSKPSALKVAWRLYFSKYDGPGDAITAVEQLKGIHDSGLDSVLDKIAFERMILARPECVDCGTQLRQGEAIYAAAEFYDNPWLPAFHTIVFLERERAPALKQAVGIGSVVLVKQLLESESFDQEKLDSALLMAAGDPMSDVSDVIDLLLRAGANINTKGKDGTTPLMLSVRNPAHVQFLINRGANLNDRDSEGKTALDRAFDAEYASEILLKRAGAQ